MWAHAPHFSGQGAVSTAAGGCASAVSIAAVDSSWFLILAFVFQAFAAFGRPRLRPPKQRSPFAFSLLIGFVFPSLYGLL